uniref:Uncharacterized protein n=1 Tax=Eutreptiella gymnastica TaxID=73025 RepID=A0A7S4G5N3_9EUGL
MWMCAARHPRLSTTVPMPKMSEQCWANKTCGPKDTPSVNITAVLLYIQTIVASYTANPAHRVNRCMLPNDAHIDQSRCKLDASTSAETAHNTSHHSTSLFSPASYL